jgi:hypothetical protein
MTAHAKVNEPRQRHVLALKDRTTRTGRPLVHDSFNALFMLSNVCKGTATPTVAVRKLSRLQKQTCLEQAYTSRPHQPTDGSLVCQQPSEPHSRTAGQGPSTRLVKGLFLVGALVARQVPPAAAGVQEPLPLIPVILIPGACTRFSKGKSTSKVRARLQRVSQQHAWMH